MMHHELCDGLDLRECGTCARHVDRYSETVQRTTVTRIKPMAQRNSCADWLEIPGRAADLTHDKL